MAAREPLTLPHINQLGLAGALKLLPGWGSLFFTSSFKVSDNGPAVSWPCGAPQTVKLPTQWLTAGLSLSRNRKGGNWGLGLLRGTGAGVGSGLPTLQW